MKKYGLMKLYRAKGITKIKKWEVVAKAAGQDFMQTSRKAGNPGAGTLGFFILLPDTKTSPEKCNQL